LWVFFYHSKVRIFKQSLCFHILNHLYYTRQIKLMGIITLDRIVLYHQIFVLPTKTFWQMVGVDKVVIAHVGGW
jgi:hypothetical protein